jgi:hypothetical protein
MAPRLVQTFIAKQAPSAAHRLAALSLDHQPIAAPSSWSAARALAADIRFSLRS